MKSNISNMKKVLITTIAVFAVSISGMAQKFIDVYQGDKIVGTMLSSDIDSVSITGTDVSSRKINFWHDGNKSNSYIVNTVDSIKVFHSEDEPLVYLGILGFNQDIYPKAIDVLATSTSNLYSNFIKSLIRKDGTLLYYGVEKALDMLEQFKFTTPLISVNLITFTDGLDQGSMMMTTAYQDENEYLSSLSKLITSTSVRGIPLTAYCLGLRGTDVTNYTQFQTNLLQLASSEENAKEVKSMSDVNLHLNEIANQIISKSSYQTISMKIPGQSNGTRVCFTFDGNSPESSSMYIEGSFNLSDRSLRNITYHGITVSGGKMVSGVQNGIFVTFTFSGLQRTDGNGLIPTNKIRHYNKAKDAMTWQINSEFTPDNNTQTIVTHSGAAIMLVLDCSNSLGSQFSDMQSYANNFISKIANNAASFSLNAPTNVTATMDENIWRVNVSWDAVKYAESYTVYRSQYPDKSFTKIAENLTGTNWQDLSLLEGNNYYRIYANGHGLTSPVSVTSNVVNCELEAPTNVTAIMYYGKRTINVSWNAVKYAESYTVYRSQYADKDFTLIADNITGTNWQDSSPLKGDNYYRIYAIGHGIISQASVTSNLVYEYLSCLDNNHPHVIDMGKAGKWACCNVGASAPWEYGGYYAWGETEEKDYYDWSTYIHCDGSAYTCHNIGSDISGTKYDVAHVKWGGNWRMPSKDRINLLINNWTYEWITINGISGRLFTSSNGNAIFLPAAGYRWNDDTDIVGDYGYYWSSTQSPSYSDGAYSLYFDSGSANTYSGDRCDGLSVRPVTD